MKHIPSMIATAGTLGSGFHTVNYVTNRRVQPAQPTPPQQTTPMDTSIRGVRAQPLQIDSSVTPDTVKNLQSTVNAKFGYRLQTSGKLDHNILGILYGHYSKVPNDPQIQVIKSIYSGAMPVSKAAIDGWVGSLGGQVQAPIPKAVPQAPVTSGFRGQQQAPKTRLDSSITSSAPILNLQMSIRSLLPADRKGSMPADGLLGPATLDAIRDVFSSYGASAMAKQAEDIKNRRMLLDSSTLQTWTNTIHNLFDGKAQASKPMSPANIIKAVSG